MSGNICNKSILKAASISILAFLFYMSCDDNGVKVVTPEVTTFEDKRDGKIYKRVTIGDQIWMAENLRYEADGSECYEGAASYKDAAANCEEYGRLYDWTTAMNGERSATAAPSGVEGVCPPGWHLPSDAEWTVLTDFVGLNVGTKLKARSWYDRAAPGVSPAPDGTDKYRFTALPGGGGTHTNGKASFAGMGYNGGWWSSTEWENDENAAYTRDIYGFQTIVRRSTADKHHSFLSVRCVHD